METVPTPKKPVVMYAIQRKSDGKWSRGGHPAKWGNLPKTWGSGPFKNHLLQYKPYSYYKQVFPYQDCEVVVFDPITGTVTERHDAAEWVWNHCYKPHLENMPDWRSKAYLKSFEDWQKENL